MFEAGVKELKFSFAEKSKALKSAHQLLDWTKPDFGKFSKLKK